MKEKLNNIIDKIKQWCIKNPKKVFVCSFAMILLSFCLSIIQYFYFPSPPLVNIVLPKMQRGSDDKIAEMEMKEKKMGELVKKMEKIKKKNTLTKSDSVTIQYLMFKYHQLNNGITQGN